MSHEICYWVCEKFRVSASVGVTIFNANGVSGELYLLRKSKYLLWTDGNLFANLLFLLGVKSTSLHKCEAFEVIKHTRIKLSYFGVEIELFYRYITGAYGNKQFAY